MSATIDINAVSPTTIITDPELQQQLQQQQQDDDSGTKDTKKPRRKSRVLARTIRRRADGRVTRQRAGRFPQRECMVYQKSTEKLFQREPFKKVLKALNKSKVTGVENQMTDGGKDWFQEILEARQIFGMRMSELFANHAGRDRVMPKDWMLFKKVTSMTY